MNEHHIDIDAEEVAKYYKKMMNERGFNISKDEADVLADIFIDFIIEKLGGFEE